MTEYDQRASARRDSEHAGEHVHVEGSSLGTLFENAPVGLRLEDFSGVKILIDGLAAQGVGDIKSYLVEHPEFVQACAQQVIVRDVNQATLALHGAATKQQLTDSLTTVFTEDAVRAFRDLVTALAHGETVFEAETTVLTLSGDTRPVFVRGLFDPRHEDWSSVYVAVVDLTETRAAEGARQDLVRRTNAARRLESLAALAGGVAHDLSNLLMVIQGNLHVALMDAEEGGSVHDSLLEIQGATDRASVLSKQMRAYAGRSRLVPKQCDLSALVSEVPRLLGSEVEIAARLELDLSDERVEVACDAAGILQVVLAMVRNAAEALGTTRGRIEVRTGLVILSEEEAAEVRRHGPVVLRAPTAGITYAYVEVEDDGRGMEASVKKRMFDPFFSTKAPGRGLGMAAALGMVRAHGGSVQVRSALGEGTRIRLLLPAASDGAEGASLPREVVEPATVSRTVLVVDDDDNLRRVLGWMLRALGYDALEAGSGRQALKRLTERSGDICCVFLDLGLPDCDGTDIFAEMRRRVPGIQIVLCSGHDEGEATEGLAGQGLAGYIQKPFLLDDLRALLDEVLPRTPPGPS